jgi:hypothetical protein
MAVGKIGWVPLEEFDSPYEHRFCETPRHRGSFTRAVRVVGFSEAGHEDLVFGVCLECWAMFDRDLEADWRL